MPKRLQTRTDRHWRGPPRPVHHGRTEGKATTSCAFAAVVRGDGRARTAGHRRGPGYTHRRTGAAAGRWALRPSSVDAVTRPSPARARPRLRASAPHPARGAGAPHERNHHGITPVPGQGHAVHRTRPERCGIRRHGTAVSSLPGSCLSVMTGRSERAAAAAAALRDVLEHVDADAVARRVESVLRHTPEYVRSAGDCGASPLRASLRRNAGLLLQHRAASAFWDAVLGLAAATPNATSRRSSTESSSPRTAQPRPRRVLRHPQQTHMIRPSGPCTS